VKCILNSEIQKGEDMKMEKTRKGLRVGLMIALMSLAASPAFARSISLKEAGAALWIFIIIGAIIILMQLIPASILFFSFIGSGTTMVFKKGKRTEEEVMLPAIEPVTVRE
jgi:membrane associated rhomboid family serine protease